MKKKIGGLPRPTYNCPPKREAQIQIYFFWPGYCSNAHPKMGGLAWEGAAVARPWPGLQMPGLCNTRSTSSRKACNPDTVHRSHQKGEFRSDSDATCSTPVLSLALVSTKIMLYLPRWTLHGEKEICWWFSKKEEFGHLSAQSFASCTPTFRRPPRSLLLPTYNLEN